MARRVPHFDEFGQAVVESTMGKGDMWEFDRYLGRVANSTSLFAPRYTRSIPVDRMHRFARCQHSLDNLAVAHVGKRRQMVNVNGNPMLKRLSRSNSKCSDGNQQSDGVNRPKQNHTSRYEGFTSGGSSASVRYHPCLLQSPDHRCKNPQLCPFRAMPANICLEYLKNGRCRKHEEGRCPWEHTDTATFVDRERSLSSAKDAPPIGSRFCVRHVLLVFASAFEGKVPELTSDGATMTLPLEFVVLKMVEMVELRSGDNDKRKAAEEKCKTWLTETCVAHRALLSCDAGNSRLCLSSVLTKILMDKKSLVASSGETTSTLAPIYELVLDGPSLRAMERLNVMVACCVASEDGTPIIRALKHRSSSKWNLRLLALCDELAAEPATLASFAVVTSLLKIVHAVGKEEANATGNRKDYLCFASRWSNFLIQLVAATCAACIRTNEDTNFDVQWVHADRARSTGIENVAAAHAEILRQLLDAAEPSSPPLAALSPWTTTVLLRTLWKSRRVRGAFALISDIKKSHVAMNDKQAAVRLAFLADDETVAEVLLFLASHGPRCRHEMVNSWWSKLKDGRLHSAVHNFEGLFETAHHIPKQIAPNTRSCLAMLRCFGSSSEILHATSEWPHAIVVALHPFIVQKMCQFDSLKAKQLVEMAARPVGVAALLLADKSQCTTSAEIASLLAQCASCEYSGEWEKLARAVVTIVARGTSTSNWMKGIVEALCLGHSDGKGLLQGFASAPRVARLSVLAALLCAENISFVFSTVSSWAVMLYLAVLCAGNPLDGCNIVSEDCFGAVRSALPELRQIGCSKNVVEKCGAAFIRLRHLQPQQDQQQAMHLLQKFLGPGSWSAQS